MTNYKHFIKYFNIEYDVNGQDLDANPKFNSVEDLHNSLPKEVIVGVDDDFLNVSNDLKDYLADPLSDETGWCVQDFDYEVCNEKPKYNQSTDLYYLMSKK